MGDRMQKGRKERKEQRRESIEDRKQEGRRERYG
jgi:hypothetical protein